MIGGFLFGVRNMINAIVKISHTSNYPNPITLCAGDEVILGREDGEWIGWIFCTSIKTGVSGWVPKQIISVIANDRGVITEDYSAHELNVDIEQSVAVERKLNGWGWCFDGSQYGWVPLDNLL